MPCDDHASLLSDPDGSLIPDGFTLGGLLSEVSDPLIPVENSPVRGTDGFCDNAANDAIRILPAEIRISDAEVVLLRELRRAFSGEVISMKWDERFASLNVEPFVTDGIRSQGYAEFGLNSLLYLLQFAMHVPLSMLIVRFPEDRPGIGLVSTEITEVTITAMRSFYMQPDVCEVCFSNLAIGGRNILQEDDYGTYQWAEKQSDAEIRDDVAWSGDNHFCDYCWLYKNYVFTMLPAGSARRQRMLEEFPCRGVYESNLDSLYDAADNIGDFE